MQEIKLKVEKLEGDTLTIFHGDAPKQLPVLAPKPVIFTGTFKAVIDYFVHRKGIGKELVNLDDTYLTYSKHLNKLLLVINAKSNYSDQIIGELKINEMLEVFCINELNHRWGVLEFANFIRIRSFLFDDGNTAKQLFESLRSVKMSGTTTIENTKDDSGNRTSNFDKKVNLPNGWMSSFTLNCEIFKGYPPEKISVDIGTEYVDGTVKIYLISVGLAEIIHTKKNEIFTATLKAFEGIPQMEY